MLTDRTNKQLLNQRLKERDHYKMYYYILPHGVGHKEWIEEREEKEREKWYSTETAETQGKLYDKKLIYHNKIIIT